MTPGRVTSRANRRMVEIRKLRRRKERELTGLFFVEGLRIVGEAVASGASIETLVVAPELLTSDYGRRLVEEQVAAGVACLEVSGDVFASLSLKDGPQGLGAVVRQRWSGIDELAVAPGRGRRRASVERGAAGLWVALDGVQDPGNLGTILRTGDAVGAAGVILLGQAADPYDPTAVRASMGSVFSLHLVRSEFPRLLEWARREGLRLVGTSGAASLDYRDASYEEPLVVILGSEREGLPKEHLAACDEVVRIPMVGRCDSLNLAVAAGLVLYEVFRRRRPED